MPNKDLILRQAIQAARAGREMTARDLFLEVVESDPGNKLAWLWLVGLLDYRNDRIEACQRVLALDPQDRQTRLMLERLEQERADEEARRREQASRSLDEIEALLKTDPKTALPMLRQVARDHADSERAWQLLAESSPSLEEQTEAWSRVAALNPAHPSAQGKLDYLQALQGDLYDLARYYEERGDREGALDTYKRIAKSSKTKEDWDRVYNNLTRLERLQAEKIRHISPTLSLARLTAGPAVLYFLSAMVHYGFAPQYIPFMMWFAFLVCILGSFLMAFASLRVHHRFWDFLGETGTSGSRLSRFSLGAAGFLLFGASFLPLLVDALIRLDRFVPPLPPF
jgi:tetratricopeptide (TPR) repeat protein